MGYDIFMLQKPPANIPGYKPQDEGDPEYWRFNAGGMAGMLRIMIKARIADRNFAAPPLSDWPPKGVLSEERAEELADWAWWGEMPGKPPTESEMQRLQPWRDALERWRRTPSTEPGRVPAFKFCTNDGWIVTPEECTIIANGLEAGVTRSRRVLGRFRGIVPSPRRSGIPRDEAAQWILQWAGYNRAAAQLGGYSVR
jgi:hypothetical protein